MRTRPGSIGTNGCFARLRVLKILSIEDAGYLGTPTSGGFLLESRPSPKRAAVYPTMRVAPVLFLAAAVVALAPARADDLQAARAALRKGDSTGAAAAVERYLVEKPNDAPGRFLKGVILSEQGHADEAIAVFLAWRQDTLSLLSPTTISRSCTRRAANMSAP